jgi:hypothetical protein
VWTIRDHRGFPTPKNSDGVRSQPFWSSLARACKIIAGVPVYRGFEPYEIDWDSFRDRWLPGLKRDGALIGVNWSGPLARGYDVESDTVREAVEFHIRSARNAEPVGGANSHPPTP